MLTGERNGRPPIVRAGYPHFDAGSTMGGAILREKIMPVHDWARVEAGIFHDFHTVWIGHLRTALNEGILPEGYYALAEQHAGRSIADVLTLHASPAPDPSTSPLPLPPATGGIAV